jgi:hypothetical protein
MKKIPTLFVRNDEDRRYVTEQVNPGCEWVLAGQGIPTRKYDGSCVMLDEHGEWWARREVKPGKQPPADFVPVEFDEATGKTMGWEPMAQSGFARWHAEALENHGAGMSWFAGTYELIGPKVNGNPEREEFHSLLMHDFAEPLTVPELTFDGIRRTVLELAEQRGIEGIVWHDVGRMAKIKARDFRA